MEAANIDRNDWHMKYFSKFWKNVKMMAWIFRFSHNTQFSSSKRTGEVVEEVIKTEMFGFKILQRNSLQGEEEKSLSVMTMVFYDYDNEEANGRILSSFVTLLCCPLKIYTLPI